MDDEPAEKESVLTSTIDNVLSESNDKNDANDSTPTSSTDAASTCPKSALNATDDPISSTSSDISEKNKITANILDIDLKNMDVVKTLACTDSDVDLLDIANVSSEPINEDVEDIVQDLENLLGESQHIDAFPIKRKELETNIDDSNKLSTLDYIVQEKFELESQNISKTIISEPVQISEDEKIQISKKNIEQEVIENTKNTAEIEIKSTNTPHELIPLNVLQDTQTVQQSIISDCEHEINQETIKNIENQMEISNDQTDVTCEVSEDCQGQKINELKTSLQETSIENQAIERMKEDSKGECSEVSKPFLLTVSPKLDLTSEEINDTDDGISKNSKCEVGIQDIEKSALVSSENVEDEIMVEPVSQPFELTQNISEIEEKFHSESTDISKNVPQSILEDITPKELVTKENVEKNIPAVENLSGISQELKILTEPTTSTSKNDKNLLDQQNIESNSEKSKVHEEILSKGIDLIEKDNLQEISTSKSEEISCDVLETFSIAKNESDRNISDSIAEKVESLIKEPSDLNMESTFSNETDLVSKVEDNISENKIFQKDNLDSETVIEKVPEQNIEGTTPEADDLFSVLEDKTIKDEKLEDCNLNATGVEVELNKADMTKHKMKTASLDEYEYVNEIIEERNTDDASDETSTEPVTEKEIEVISSKSDEIDIVIEKESEKIEMLKEYNTDSVPLVLTSCTDPVDEQDVPFSTIDDKNTEKIEIVEKDNTTICTTAIESNPDKVIEKKVEVIPSTTLEPVKSDFLQEDNTISIKAITKTQIENSMEQEKMETSCIEGNESENIEMQKVERTNSNEEIEQVLQHKTEEMIEPLVKSDPIITEKIDECFETCNEIKDGEVSKIVVEEEINDISSKKTSKLNPINEKLKGEINEDLSIKEIAKENLHLKTIQDTDNLENTKFEILGTHIEDQHVSSENVMSEKPINFIQLETTENDESISIKPAAEEEIISKKTVLYDHDCIPHTVVKSCQSKVESCESEGKSSESVEKSTQYLSQMDLESKPEFSINTEEEIQILPLNKDNKIKEVDDISIDASKIEEKIIGASKEASIIKTTEQTNIDKLQQKQLGSTESSGISIVVNQDQDLPKNIIENPLHDQTTAAVQSILDNMLAEEHGTELFSDKDETPVLHSSYSSYELQKAVQQIQDISGTDHIDEIPQDIPYITESVKQVESQEILISELKPKSSENIKQTEVEIIQEQNKIPKKAESIDVKNEFSFIKETKEEPVKLSDKLGDEIFKNTKIETPIVKPSIDLSEESSSEESIEEENEEIKTNPPSQSCKLKSNIISKENPQTGSIETIKEKSHFSKQNMEEPLSICIEETEKEKIYSPKITIKPIKEDEPIEDKEEHKGSLKITITKQSDNTHSILKIYSPDSEQKFKQTDNEEQNVVPKLVIKTSDMEQHSPKMSTRSSKQNLNVSQRSGSPRITIKPIVKPDIKETPGSPLKIIIKPLGKPEEFSKLQQKHSPKLLKSKAEDDHYSTRSKIMKLPENSEMHSPKVTIKPVLKPSDETPKIIIKHIEKSADGEVKMSPKITIKPLIKPVELENLIEEEIKGRIVLKINKGNIPTKESDKANREMRKRDQEDDKSEKLAKIKLKFSKGGDAHIVHDQDKYSPNKRSYDSDSDKCKRLKCEDTDNNSDEDVRIIENRQSPIVISEDSRSQDSVIIIEEQKDPLAETPVPHPEMTFISNVPVQPLPPQPPTPRKRGRPRKVPLVVREEFGNFQKQEPPQQMSQPQLLHPNVNEHQETEISGRPKRSCRGQSVRDTLGIKTRKPKSAGKGRGRGRGRIAKNYQKEQVFTEEKINLLKKSLTEEALDNAHSSGILKLSHRQIEQKLIQPFELKGLLEAAKDQNIIEIIEVDTPSSSPKSEDISNKSKILGYGNKNETSRDGIKNPLELSSIDNDSEMQPPTPVFIQPLNESSSMDISHSSEIAMFEEETRMSAEANSRAQTPAKQVVSTDVIEESQSSMQSTATTESGKISRRSRLEVHHELDISTVTADQLNEYYWGGNGPYMIQEQVAQFLGIKSFKRKYPGIPRRMVDMQERDYIRENGLASESMCDLGLTAVNSQDILDIMYSDFQDKYEDYCKHQRDKQTKELMNKQKALTLATGLEKNKLDIIDQAIHSAASFNANFNKARREQRKACMDLQTMNVHYPKGKMKKINLNKVGHYPVTVVPGQFTDFYLEFTPNELQNLPLNTVIHNELCKARCDGSDSDSDSSNSDSDDSSSSESDSDSSCDDSCKMCNTNEKRCITPRKSPIHATV